MYLGNWDWAGLNSTLVIGAGREGSQTQRRAEATALSEHFGRGEGVRDTERCRLPAGNRVLGRLHLNGRVLCARSVEFAFGGGQRTLTFRSQWPPGRRSSYVRGASK